MSRKKPSQVNQKKIKRILEDQEVEETNEELVEVNEKLVETNEELTEENEELEIKVEKTKKEIVWLVIFMLLLAIILGSGIGYYYFQNMKTGQNLSESTKKTQSAEEKATNESKLKMEQEIKGLYNNMRL